MKFFLICLALVTFTGSSLAWSGNAVPSPGQENGQTLSKPRTHHRHRRHHRSERSNNGIKSSFGNGGKSAGRGGKSFGKNIAKGKPIVAGRDLGKGAAGLGKGVGKGVENTTKRVVKP